MWSKYNHVVSYVRVRHLLHLTLVLVLLGNLMACKPSDTNEPEEPEQTTPMTPEEVNTKGTVVFKTDSTEWIVYTFREGVLAYQVYSVSEPFHVPTKEEANFLRTLTYGPTGERYLIDNGTYTFGMPSATVSKAGTKKKYSVLGLYIKETVIIMYF